MENLISGIFIMAGAAIIGIVSFTLLTIYGASFLSVLSPIIGALFIMIGFELL
jgi:hypothetical protein